VGIGEACAGVTSLLPSGFGVAAGVEAADAVPDRSDKASKAEAINDFEIVFQVISVKHPAPAGQGAFPLNLGGETLEQLDHDSKADHRSDNWEHEVENALSVSLNCSDRRANGGRQNREGIDGHHGEQRKHYGNEFFHHSEAPFSDFVRVFLEGVDDESTPPT
jgi:hypothetical protein